MSDIHPIVILVTLDDDDDDDDGLATVDFSPILSY